MTQYEILKKKVENTVGYKESENKPEFMKGAEVALSKSEDYYSEIINDKDKLLAMWKGYYESLNDEMKILAKSISKLLSHDNN